MSRSTSRRRRRRRRRFSWIEYLLDADILWSALAVIVVLTILVPRSGVRSFDYTVGDIAAADVIAPVDVQVEDAVFTERRRSEAIEEVLEVYDFDPLAWRLPVESLNSLFAWGREARTEMSLSWEELDPERGAELEASAEEVAGLSLESDLTIQLWGEGFTAETELAIERLLRNLLLRSMIGDPDLLGLGSSQQIIVRDVVSQQERRLEDLSVIIGLEPARNRIERQIEEEVELPPGVAEVLGGFAATLLLPNLTYNSNETQVRRNVARESVPPVFYQIRRGQALLRAGDEVTEQKLQELRSLRTNSRGARNWFFAAGLLLMLCVTLLALWSYAAHHVRRFRFQKVRRLYLLLLLMLVGSIVLTHVLLFIGEAVANAFTEPPFNYAESYAFAIPFAAGPLLVLLLVDTQVAWSYAAFQALAVGAVTGRVELTLFSMLGSFAAVYGMGQYKQRTEMLRTGFLVAGVGVATVLSLRLIQRPPLPVPGIAFEAGLAIIGGIQVTMLASALLPALEHIFQSLTDVKLLELSNMNLPLLKQLAVAAPGTYHHSVVVGTLAEKAAEAIDANPLFARVAAYYHDIGKMRQPEYFVENQKSGKNPHDKLSPHMSALVLVSHIKEGIAFAEEHGLPAPLVDVIPQHHGTRLMQYFYRRAVHHKKEGDEEVRDADFRYPGPLPQTKEAALIMMADTVEAVSRLVEDPSPARLRTMIRDNIRDILEDGQLDECNLTLADLTRVADAFLTVVAGMHHQRIDYGSDSPAKPQPEAAKGEVASP